MISERKHISHGTCTSAADRVAIEEQTPERFKPVTRSNVAATPEWENLDPDLRAGIEVISAVLPFRTHRDVMEELIDWSNVPDDPIVRLTFPHRDMLTDEQFEQIERLLGGDDKDALNAAIHAIRMDLNPHPAGQMTHNVPTVGGEPVPGIQHKYDQTVLFFPAAGQTCHAYCTFCFRWAQFVGMDDLKFANKDVDQLGGYLQEHPEVTDVLFTGGDPMVMKSKVFARYVDRILEDPELSHVQTIRIGTKSVAYWPQRYVTDSDADELLDVFRRIVDSGRTVAVMGHYSHPVELSTPVAREAVRRIRGAGANIRMQSPLIRHVNDDPDVWARMWNLGVQLGCVPYYFFVERDTGARGYFETPLHECHRIYREAYQQVSGIARTVRGPSMSAFPGKVHVLGVQEVGGEKAFVLEYLQCRHGELVRQPFFAKFDPDATWFDTLEPLTAADERFFPGGWSTIDSDAPGTVPISIGGSD